MVWAALASLYVARLGSGFSFNLLLLGAYALLAALLLVIRRPGREGEQPDVIALVAWATVALSLFGFETTGAVRNRLGLGLQVAGLVAALASLASLGRSFGVAPANRGVVGRWAYRFVRHPLYAAELVNILGYVIAQPSALNVLVAALIAGGQMLRIRAEETLLMTDPAYQAYAAAVRWRLVPGFW